MAHIPLDPPRTLLDRLAEWYSRRTYDAVLDPVRHSGTTHASCSATPDTNSPSPGGTGSTRRSRRWR
jgi:hypothetical protein